MSSSAMSPIFLLHLWLLLLLWRGALGARSHKYRGHWLNDPGNLKSRHANIRIISSRSIFEISPQIYLQIKNPKIHFQNLTIIIDYVVRTGWGMVRSGARVTAQGVDCTAPVKMILQHPSYCWVDITPIIVWVSLSLGVPKKTKKNLES